MPKSKLRTYSQLSEIPTSLDFGIPLYLNVGIEDITLFVITSHHITQDVLSKQVTETYCALPTRDF